MQYRFETQRVRLTIIPSRFGNPCATKMEQLPSLHRATLIVDFGHAANAEAEAGTLISNRMIDKVKRGTRAVDLSRTAMVMDAIRLVFPRTPDFIGNV